MWYAQNETRHGMSVSVCVFVPKVCTEKVFWNSNKQFHNLIGSVCMKTTSVPSFDSRSWVRKPKPKRTISNEFYWNSNATHKLVSYAISKVTTALPTLVCLNVNVNANANVCCVKASFAYQIIRNIYVQEYSVWFNLSFHTSNKHGITIQLSFENVFRFGQYIPWVIVTMFVC